VIVPGRLFQPSTMFADKARSIPKSGTPEKCSNVKGCGLTRKHYTRLVKLDKDKHSILLRILVNYVRKKFNNTGLMCCDKEVFLTLTPGCGTRFVSMDHPRANLGGVRPKPRLGNILTREALRKGKVQYI
jgi:hypothetical protein